MKQRVTVRVRDSKTTLRDVVSFNDPREYVFEGDVEVTVEDLEFYVRVSVQGHRGTWTYRDPFGDLGLGEVVRVPFGEHDDLRLATVVGVRVPPFEGHNKDVNARFAEVAA